jgi:probable F420-dependent oxidoreductase
VHHYDRGHGVLVALHGHGDEPATARFWGRRMAPPGWEVVAPGAARDDDGVRSWFRTTPTGVDGATLRTSARRVAALVADLRGDAGRPVVVVGFSQGAALALGLGAVGVQPDAVVAICGFVPEVSGGSSTLRPEVGDGPRHPATLIVGREDDEVVPAFFSADAEAAVRAEGGPAALQRLPGGHVVDELAIDTVRRWVADVVAPEVRVSLGLPVDRVETGAELVSGRAIADLATTYERAGFHAAYVTDHPAPEVRWLAGGGHHALEPTVALAVAATATQHLLLHTNVYVLGYRNPFLAAKAIASLDVVSDGRLVLGVAAGYLRAEFDAVEVPYDGRGARLDESLRVLRSLFAGDPLEVEGGTVTPLPLPVQFPGPPVWIGGNSAAAIRRAVEFGDGWSPFPTPGGLERYTGTRRIADHEDLAAGIRELDERSAAAGRAERPVVCFVPFSLGAYLEDPDGHVDELADEVAHLGAIGVEWVALTAPGTSRLEVARRANDLAERLGLRHRAPGAVPGT